MGRLIVLSKIARWSVTGFGHVLNYRKWDDFSSLSVKKRTENGPIFVIFEVLKPRNFDFNLA